jgi:hypothetical protein
VNEPKPLLADPYSFEEGERVLVTPSDDPNDLVRNEFMGVVMGVKNGTYVMVKDADDDVFDVDAVQCHHVK